jgi:chromosome segregation ATPase
VLRDENARLKQIDGERKDIEEQLVQSKIKSANLDLENDQLAHKVQTKNEQIKMFSERITALEVELLKTKQELGEALNIICDYEQ